MALIDQFQASTESGFQQRVQVAMCAAAINIQAESALSLNSVDAAAAATTINVVSGAVFSVNDLIAIGVGLGTVETRKITAISTNALTVSATTNAHKAGEVVQKVIWNHTNRANYSKLVLNNPNSYVQLFCDALASNDASFVPPTSSLTDTQINNGVSAVYNALAGTV